MPSPKAEEREPGLEAAITKAGSISALARALGIRQSTVAEWARIPAAHVLKIEQLFDIRRHELRPDLYPPPRRPGRPRKPVPQAGPPPPFKKGPLPPQRRKTR